MQAKCRRFDPVHLHHFLTRGSTVVIELRYVYDCERLENLLEYREVQDGTPVTAWQKVPFVYTIGINDYKDPKDIVDSDEEN